MAPSSELIWQCLRKHNSFMRNTDKTVRRGQQWSAELGNLMGFHAEKFSGLVNKVLDVANVKVGNKDKIMIVKSHTNTGKSKVGGKNRFPGRRIVQTGVTKNEKKGLVALTQATAGKWYRRDLSNIAARKFMKIRTTFRKNKVMLKKVVKCH